MSTQSTLSPLTKNKVVKISLLSLLNLLILLTFTGPVFAEPDFFGKENNVPLNKTSKTPSAQGVDAFGSEVYIDGRTDVNVDSKSMAAAALQKEEQEKLGRKIRIGGNIDTSLKADISSGETVKVLIAPDHFTQLSFLREGEIVYPKRAYAAQPGLIKIEKKEGSPYIYVEAAVYLENQSTNFFVETEEEGRIQTYCITMVVTEPKNVRNQIAINLVSDLTPPIKGGIGSEEERLKANELGGKINTTRNFSPSGHDKFSRDDVRKYVDTMIAMAEHFTAAKQLEREEGKTIYRDQDIMKYPGGRHSYIDPVDRVGWGIENVWYFQRYDAILLEMVAYNDTNRPSEWDYSQIKWQVNNAKSFFSSTAMSPESVITLPQRTNKVWVLLQGEQIDPEAEFIPVFPRKEKRIVPQLEIKNERRMIRLNPNEGK